MKKIVSLLLVIALVFTLGGCFGEETEKVTPEDVKNRVISEATQYLKETYPDDEFTYISGRSPNWAYNYYEIGFSSKNYDNQEVVVFGTSTDEIVDGKTVYSYYDTYYQYYMNDEAEKYFYDIAKEYISDDIVVKIDFITTIAVAEKIDNKLGFENNYKNSNVGFTLYVFTESDTKENDKAIQTIIKQFKNQGNKLWLEYAVVDDLNKIANSDIKRVLEDGFIEGEKIITYSTAYDEENNYQEE